MSIYMAVNSGSSSLKFQLYDMPSEQVIASGIAERIGLKDGIFTLNFKGKKYTNNVAIPDHEVAVKLMVNSLLNYKVIYSLKEIEGMGHRIVQGGDYFDDSVIVNDEVVKKVDELKDLAPLHNPVHLACYKAMVKYLPDVKHVFVFDTAFHQTMDAGYYLYPVPYEWYTDYKVRKYGAHGTSHKYIAQRTADIMNRNIKDLNIITLHLGSGASITAVKKGISVNTSMGFSPLGGIMMGTRCGDIDPTIIYYMEEKLNCTSKDMENYLNRKSGLLGVSGISSDTRDIESAIEKGDERAAATYDLYINRIVSFVGSYYMQLGHVDALTFTAGVGEHSVMVRAKVLKKLEEGLGLKIDYFENSQVKGDTKLSLPDSKVNVFVIGTNEELEIVRDTYRLLNDE